SSRPGTAAGGAAGAGGSPAGCGAGPTGPDAPSAAPRRCPTGDAARNVRGSAARLRARRARGARSDRCGSCRGRSCRHPAGHGGLQPGEHPAAADPPVVLAHGAVAGGRGQAGPAGGVVGERVERAGERGHVPGLDQHAQLAVLEQRRDGADRGGDHRQAGGEVLVDLQRGEVVLAGGVRGGRDVEAVQELGHVLGGDGPVEADPLRDPELGGEELELLLLRPGAADVQLEPLIGACQGVQQQVGAVPGLEGAHEADPHRGVRRRGGGRARGGGDPGGVDAGGCHDHAGRLGALLPGPLRHRLAHASHEGRAVQLTTGRRERSGLVGEAAVGSLLGDQRRVDLEDRGDRPCIGLRGGGEARGHVGEQGVPLVDEVEAVGGHLLGDRGGGRGDGLLALGAGAPREAVTAHVEVGEVGRDVVVRAGAEDGHLVAVGAQGPDHLLHVHGGTLGAEHSDAGVEQGVGDPHDRLLPEVVARAGPAGAAGRIARVTAVAAGTAGGAAGGTAGAAGAAAEGASGCAGSSIGWVGMLRWPERSARVRRRRAWEAESYSVATSSRAASVSAERSVAGSSACLTALISAAVSPVGTSQPVLPSRTTSPTAVTEAATHGMPVAIASSSTVGRPSALPSAPIPNGATKRSASSSSCRTSSWVRGPSSCTCCRRPSSSMRAASCSRSGPSPTISARTSRPSSRSAWATSISWSKPFFSTSRPTPSSTGTSASPARRRYGKRSSSRPLRTSSRLAVVSSPKRARRWRRLYSLMVTAWSASRSLRARSAASTSRWKMSLAWAVKE